MNDLLLIDVEGSYHKDLALNPKKIPEGRGSSLLPMAPASCSMELASACYDLPDFLVWFGLFVCLLNALCICFEMSVIFLFNGKPQIHVLLS